MKQLLLVAFVFLASIAGKAQTSNLIFFTEQGERFSVVLNGILQNQVPETNIKVTGLPAPSYKLKIIFDDKKLGEFDKTLYINQGNEVSYTIRRNNKNVYVVRFMNEVPLAQAPIQVQNQSVILYHTEPITTTTTTTTISNPSGVGIGMNINDPYSGGGVNMSLNIGGLGTQTSTTTTTTTTSGNANVSTTQDGMVVRVTEEDHNQRHGTQQQERYVLEGYNGAYGCPWPIAPGDFDQAKSSISSKSFEDSKLTIARQIIQTNCLLSSQVKEILLLFSFEDTRLDFAKYAYAYTLDLGNYYKINDAFTFKSSIDELNNYIQGFRR